MLVGDKRRFTQVMINLVKNALKFTHQKQGRIRVTAAYDNENKNLMVSVKDTGVGIAPDDLP